MQMFGAVIASGVLSLAPEDSFAETFPEHPEKRKRDVLHKLDQLYKNAWKQLRERSAFNDGRYTRLLIAVSSKKWHIHQKRLMQAWDPVKDPSVLSSGASKDVITMEDYMATQRTREAILRGWEKGEALKIDIADPDPDFYTRVALLAEEAGKQEAHFKKLLMTDADGNVLGLYPEEQKKRPRLTHEQYMDELMWRLRSPEDLAMFQRLFFRYTFDSPDPEADPHKTGSAKTSRDHWQPPSETLERVNDGCMLGDCEDQAMLLREMVKRWGHKPFVFVMPRHGTCIWISQNMDDRYDAFDTGTLGLNKNGIPFGMEDGTMIVSASYLPDSMEAHRGFASPQEALEAVIAKYNRLPSWKHSTIVLKNGFTILPEIDGIQRLPDGRLDPSTPLQNFSLDRLHERIRDPVPPPPPEQ